MNMTNDDWLSASLAQRLRRLGLLEDERTFPELDSAGIASEVQMTLLGSSNTRSAVRWWIDRSRRGRDLTSTELLVALEQMRLQPSLASPLLSGLPGKDYGNSLAACAMEVGRNLHSKGRTYFANGNIDTSVNYMLEAQREFLFALSTGYLPVSETTEALGKYAVAVAFSSRWRKTNASVLKRALEYHSRSISAGNQSPEAYGYLVELKAELFNATSDPTHLNGAIAVAEERGFQLSLAELLLKRGVLRSTSKTEGWSLDLQHSSRHASNAHPQTGVDYVQKALTRQLALSAIVKPCPLNAEQIRLPYGFLGNLPQLSHQRRDYLRVIVLEALNPMRQKLRDRGSRPNLVAQQVLFAVLRDSVTRAGQNAVADSELVVEVARESMERDGDKYLAFQYADALLARAEAMPQPNFVSEAVNAAEALIGRYPKWPLPRVTYASALALQDRLESSCSEPIRAAAAWLDAAESVVESPDYRRTDLGGRSSVFAVEDARGDLATALIFKPASSRTDAEREANHMEALLNKVRANEAEERFGVPRSLGIVRLADHDTIHVIERQVGQLMSDLDPEVASSFLQDCVEFLAFFHNAAGRPDQERSGWRKLKGGLKLCGRTLFHDQDQSDEFVAKMRQSFPNDLPLVKKRDAHSGNWVVDSANRLIAVDLEAGSFLPVGHDVAQLVEDYAVLPVSDEGFARRRELIQIYVTRLDVDVDADVTIAAYGWFSLLRATWIASSASASKARHAHARQLAQYLATTTDQSGVRAPAEMLVAALHQFTGVNIGGTVDASHRRRSKQLSQVLRHRALTLGLDVDDAGFVRLEDLADTVSLSIDEIVAVAAHPAEPRFEIDERRIRALYGHSFPVPDLPDLDVEPPKTLFHGTSWDALPLIAAEGLRPMGRQKVYLTNNPTEALEVARRRSKPALLAISAADLQSLQAVADAVWAADSVAPSELRVLNPFAEIPSPPGWLTDLIADHASALGQGD